MVEVLLRCRALDAIICAALPAAAQGFTLARDAQAERLGEGSTAAVFVDRSWRSSGQGAIHRRQATGTTGSRSDGRVVRRQAGAMDCSLPGADLVLTRSRSSPA